MNPQFVGSVLVTVGAALLWSVWALVIAGVLLMVVPEVVAARRRRRAL